MLKPIFWLIWMTTLKKLKQYANQYHKEALEEMHRKFISRKAWVNKYDDFIANVKMIGRIQITSKYRYVSY